MKRILFTSLTSSPHLNLLLNTLSKNEKVELDVIFEVEKSSRRSWNPGVINFKHRVLNSISYKMKTSLDLNLYRILNSFRNVDFVILGTSPWSINTWITLLWCVMKNKKYITFSEAPNIKNNQLQAIKNILHHILFNNASGYLCVSSHALKHYNKVYGNKPSIITPYHTDLTKFKEVNLKVNKDIKNFVFLGELTQRKNVIGLLEQFLKVREDITLTFIGDGCLKPDLISIANKNENIKFVDKISNDRVADFLSYYDCLILPSFDDGYGMVVIEALATGLPVIASNKCMSAVDNIIDGYNGWTFDIENNQGIKKAILASLDSNLVDLSINARNSIKSTTAENSVDKIVNLLNTL